MIDFISESSEGENKDDVKKEVVETLLKLGWQEYAIREFQDYAHKKLGGDWAAELLKIAGDVPAESEEFSGEEWALIYKTWDVVEYRLKPKDIPGLAKLLSKKVIINDPNCSLLRTLVKKITELSNDSVSGDYSEAVENIKKGIGLSIDSVKGLTDIRGDALAIKYGNVFYLAKTQLLLDPISCDEIDKLINEESEILAPYIKEQMSRLIKGAKEGRGEDVRRAEFLYPEKTSTSVDITFRQIESQIETITDEEAVRLSVKIFKEDFAEMATIIRDRYVSTGASNTSSVRVIAAQIPNVASPILLARPHDFEIEDLSDESYQQQGVRLEHSPMFKCWFLMAKEKPNSDRGKLFWYLYKNNMQYRDIAHLSASISVDEKRTIVTMEDGWNDFKEKYEKPTQAMLRLRSYGFDFVKSARYSSVSNDLAKMVLEFEMDDLIKRYSDRLAKVVPPNRVRVFRTLAKKYLKNPDASQKTYEYRKFKELFDLAGNLTKN